MRAEWVIRVDGTVKARTPETVEPEPARPAASRFSPTEIEVLSEARDLPMPVFGDVEYPEETRLRYRFLDLRRDKLHRNIMKRSAIISSIRRRMIDAGFFEFQTPILTASSPEGARDFLVPSRLHPGKFYALPQAPQQFKQLIMIAGFDRYFQIAPCFRDEDARADRSPGEFYQLDVEMSFVEQDDVFARDRAGDARRVRGIRRRQARDRRVPAHPLRRGDAEIRHRQAGPAQSDRDGRRHRAFAGSGFKVFAGQIAADPRVEVWAIPAPTGGNRAFCDRMNSWAQGEGQPGLGYIFFRDDGEGAGPIAKNIGPERTEAIRERLGLKDGDAVFFVCGRPEKFAAFAGAGAQPKVGRELKLIDEDAVRLLLDRRFPDVRVERGGEEDRLLPQPVLDAELRPRRVPGARSGRQGHDPVDQGDPVRHRLQRRGAVVRRDPQPQAGDHEQGVRHRRLRRERARGEVRRDAVARSSYGAPPHGGIAPGIDRIVMLLCGEENLREVTLFPMNQRAEDLMMGAPSEVTAKQLRELHIRLALPE